MTGNQRPIELHTKARADPRRSKDLGTGIVDAWRAARVAMVFVGACSGGHFDLSSGAGDVGMQRAGVTPFCSCPGNRTSNSAASPRTRRELCLRYAVALLYLQSNCVDVVRGDDRGDGGGQRHARLAASVMNIGVDEDDQR